MEHSLYAEDFILKISVKVFEGDLTLPVNTTMKAEIQGEYFAVKAAMDIDVRALAAFSRDLCRIYTVLSGEARLEEPYGQQYLSFAGDGRGHLTVTGQLGGQSGAGDRYDVEFVCCSDQTCLMDFCQSLWDTYGGYLL